MPEPGSIPAVPWWISADIHTILTYIKVAASDISDADTIKFIKTDSLGRIETVQPTADHETVVALTDQTAGTFTYYLDMSSYHRLGLQIEITAGSGSVSLKTYGTCMNLARASCTYQDISAELPAPDPITSDIIIMDADGVASCCRYLKFVFTVVNAASDSDFAIYARKVH